MEHLCLADRAKLDQKIMEALSEILENSDVLCDEVLPGDSASQTSSKYHCSTPVSQSGKKLCSSVIEEARTAGLEARLELTKKRNALQKQISEREMDCQN